MVMPPPSSICLGEGGKRSWFLFSSLPKRLSAAVVTLSGLHFAKLKGGPSLQHPHPPTQDTRASGHNNQALLAAPIQGRAQGRGSGGPAEGVQRPAPLHTHCLPRAQGLPPPQQGAARVAGTLCKARRTYIWRARRQARAAPLRSAPLPAASVLLGRPPAAAA